MSKCYLHISVEVMGLRMDILEVVAVASAVSTSDTEHLDQDLVSSVGLYHIDRKRPVSASCDDDDDGAYSVAPCDQSVSNIVAGIAVMAEGSPSVASHAAAVGGHTADAGGHLVDHCHNYACTEPAVVGVAAVEGDVAGVAWRAKQHAALDAAGTWGIVG